MARRRFSWLVALLALVEAGWFAFDGAHAFLVGDYVTPASGELGPWSHLVSAVGIEPRSDWMKGLHLGLGSVWLVVLGCFLARRTWARTGMIVCAVLGLWYLPFGTLLSTAQLVLLRREKPSVSGGKVAT